MANQQSDNNNYSVDTWSNSIDYLQKIARHEDIFLEASMREDVDTMVLSIRNLCTLLKRMLKSRKDAGKKEAQIFSKKSKHYLIYRIAEAKKKYDISQRSDLGSETVRRNRNRLYNQSLEELRECFEDLGDFQLANNLTFKEGDDPNEAWALG